MLRFACWSVLLCLVFTPHRGRAETPTRVAAKKERATREFRARRYDIACPLFVAVVTATPHDAWGWNDLALCRIRAGALAEALEPLERAATLERAVRDEKLRGAISTNEALLTKALLSLPRLSAAQATVAVALVDRRDEPHDEDCGLLEKARVAAEASLGGKAWLRLASCAPPGPVLVEALLRARAAGEDPGPPWKELVERGGTAGPDWKSGCRPLDGARCGRRWWLCSKPEQENAMSARHVVIEAASVGAWKQSPFDVAGERALESSSWSEDLRCPVPDSAMSAVDSREHEDVALGFDACAQTYLRWRWEKDGCDPGVSHLSLEHFELLTPP